MIRPKIQIFDNRSLWFFLGVGIVSSILWLMGDSTLNALMYHRDAIISGEFWRYLSGHLVHSNGWHLLLNLASLTMIGLLFSSHLSIILWALVFVLSGVMISSGYFFVAVQFQSYVGLSAILYAVIIIGALLDIKQQPLIAVLVLVVVTGRVIWQQFSGSMESLASIIEDRVAIESHLFGIISGYIQGFALLLWQYKKAPNPALTSDNNS